MRIPSFILEHPGEALIARISMPARGLFRSLPGPAVAPTTRRNCAACCAMRSEPWVSIIFCCKGRWAGSGWRTCRRIYIDLQREDLGTRGSLAHLSPPYKN